MMLWQPHLLSIAENINEAEFNPKEYERIDAVISMEGERVQVSITFYFSLRTFNIKIRYRIFIVCSKADSS